MRNRASLISDEDASNDDDDCDDEHDETNYDFIGSMIYQKAIKLRFQLLAITKPNQKRSRSENAEKAPDSWAISGYEEGSPVIWISTEIADYGAHACVEVYRKLSRKSIDSSTKKDEHDHRGREFVCALRPMGKNDMNDHRREMASNAMDKDELLAPVTDDYKLVRLVQFYVQVYDSFDSEVKVYSLKANSWRRIQDFPYYLCYKRGYGVLANNALHWVVSRKPESDTRNLIVAFDLRTEDCFEVPQPDYVDECFHFNVGVLGGCCCGLCNYIDARVDIWVMNEYGMNESWIKLFSVAQKEVIVGFEFLRPLAYSKSGDKVLLDQDNENFVWYDLKWKRAERVRIQGSPKSLEAEMCVASLLPLSGRNVMKQQAPTKEV